MVVSVGRVHTRWGGQNRLLRMRNGRRQRGTPQNCRRSDCLYFKQKSPMQDQSKSLMCLIFLPVVPCGGFIPATWSCPAQFAGDFRGKGGPNRSVGLAFCAARCMLLQCGSERFPRVTAALLGRFLPRLGPLAMRAALFLTGTLDR